MSLYSETLPPEEDLKTDREGRTQLDHFLGCTTEEDLSRCVLDIQIDPRFSPITEFTKSPLCLGMNAHLETPLHVSSLILFKWNVLMKMTPVLRPHAA